ncbi:NAD(P)/FAD-dependent oxidoreductase [Nocardia sp. alder85J]|uniref:NAD(P)/FAD-dependent oxidoreductase n=1 Tax=Nocardia sp. alder85J TaxID=2862949 RepID=UPI001CD1F69F|nr:FAD-dependent oxidoreductase [Nocardia sp. alder85J]MCX4091980.1 FAD-dependent oxidoreductase [Nocardia sp. alder85J]
MTGAGPFAVAVVGAGVIGAGIAHHLQVQHIPTIAFDSAEPGHRRSAASANSGGIVRAVHTATTETVLTVESSRAYRRMDLASEGGLGYTAAGFVFITDRGRRQAILDRVALLHSLDYPAQLLDHAQLSRRWPEITWRADDLGLFEAASGSVDVRAVVAAFQRGLVTHGGALATETVVSLAPAAGRRWLVTTADGASYTSAAVVLAGGPHTADLLRTRGHELPIGPARMGVVELAVTGAGIPRELSFIDDITGGYAISRADTTYIGANGRVAPHDSLGSLTAAESGAIRAAAAARLPATTEIPVADTMVGIDATTVDGRPIIEELEPRLFVCTGFSGGGAKIAPEIGRLTAQWLRTGERPSILSGYAFPRRKSDDRPDQDETHDIRAFSYL